MAVVKLYDAHSHLPDAGSSDCLTTDLVNLKSIDLRYSVINGTSPTDWTTVLDFAKKNSQLLPAIGLHPQKVQSAPRNWKDVFLKILDSYSVCAIGEIGLDRRNQNYDIEEQLNAFCWQLEQAYTRNISVSIHCLKATGLLMEVLRNHNLPSRGIHLHAYNCSAELIPELVELGAYFSFSARQLKCNSKKVRNQILAIPIQRLLIETDGNCGNDFSTLYNCYTRIAQIRKMPLHILSECVGKNFEAYFLAQQTVAST